MLVYLATKSEFRDDIDSNRIDEKVHAGFTRRHAKRIDLIAGVTGPDGKRTSAITPPIPILSSSA